jgi:hypothetical protein
MVIYQFTDEHHVDIPGQFQKKYRLFPHKYQLICFYNGDTELSLKLYTDRPPRTLVESDSTICCMYTVYPPEDEYLRIETCRRT